MSPGSPWAVDHQCELCGKDTVVNLRTGRMNVHRQPDAPANTQETCPESGTLMVEPDSSEPDQAGDDPDLSRCSDCDHDIKVAARTGQLYSHTPPNSTEACRGSGRQVRAADPAIGSIVEVTRVDEPPVPSDVRPVQSSSSVYAVPAGLPSTGRRRK